MVLTLDNNYIETTEQLSSVVLCAVHGVFLGGVSPLWGNSLQPLVEDKGVHREVESEGSPRQITGLRNTNHIRQYNWIRVQNNLKSE